MRCNPLRCWWQLVQAGAEVSALGPWGAWQPSQPPFKPPWVLEAMPPWHDVHAFFFKEPAWGSWQLAQARWPAGAVLATVAWQPSQFFTTTPPWGS